MCQMPSQKTQNIKLGKPSLIIGVNTLCTRPLIGITGNNVSEPVLGTGIHMCVRVWVCEEGPETSSICAQCCLSVFNYDSGRLCLSEAWRCWTSAPNIQRVLPAYQRSSTHLSHTSRTLLSHHTTRNTHGVTETHTLRRHAMSTNM